MSQSRILNRSGLFAAATAIGAATLLTIPAQSDPACQSYRFNGLFLVNHHNNGWSLRLNSNDAFRLRGSAFAENVEHMGDGRIPRLNGTVEGQIVGREIEFTTYWNNGSIGVYRGLVDTTYNYASGSTFDQTHPEATDTWDGKPVECSGFVPGPPGSVG